MIKVMGWLLDKGWDWLARKVIPVDDNLYSFEDED